jgi:HD-GYP domain-containing protein (c-di-GMP phosphodiesterase class II)/anti-sigma regulatory factor (Ser/Thr protein kinase)
MRLNVYVGIMISIGLTAILYSFNIAEVNRIPYLLLLLLFGLLFAIYEVELPYGRFYSGTSNIFIISFILFGLNNALVTLVLISLIEIFYYKYGWKKGLYNLSQDSLCLILSVFTFNLLKSETGVPESLYDFTLVAIIILTYHILNLIFLSGVFYILRSESYFQVILGIFKDAVPTVCFSIFLSLFLLSTYREGYPFLFIQSLLFVFIVFMIIRYVFQHYVKIRKSHFSIIDSLTQMTDQKTFQDQHAARVGWISKQIGEAIKLSPEQLDQLYYSAMLHDIGKTSINENIFRKKGPLTLEEQKEYESHVQLGSEWLSNIEGFQNIANIVLHHHERWDGKGFPAALSENQIPYLSRIIAIANEMDHLIRKEKSTAFKKIKKMAGSQLDPHLVAVTIELTHILDSYEDSQEITKWIMMSDYVSEVRQKVYNSELLNRFGVNHIVYYAEGRFYNHSNQHANLPCSSEITPLAEQSIREGQPIRHNLHDRESGIMYDVYCLPAGRAANILLFDVTQVIGYEKEQEIKMRKIYKDVIYAVTQAKMLLVEGDELEVHLKGDLAVAHPIHEPTDITKCRHIIDSLISPIITDPKRKYKILLCINECLTNVLKHAQQGEMKFYSTGDTFKILIQDNGNGIDLADLPKSTLMQGYSTKLSLGQGFKLMMSYSDRLILSTNSSGTSILLEFNKEPQLNSSIEFGNEGEMKFA